MYAELDQDKPIQAFPYRYWNEREKRWELSEEEHDNPSGLYSYHMSPDGVTGIISPRYVHPQGGFIDDHWEPGDHCQEQLCDGDWES